MKNIIHLYTFPIALVRQRERLTLIICVYKSFFCTIQNCLGKLNSVCWFNVKIRIIFSRRYRNTFAL